MLDGIQARWLGEAFRGGARSEHQTRHGDDRAAGGLVLNTRNQAIRLLDVSESPCRPRLPVAALGTVPVSNIWTVAVSPQRESKTFPEPERPRVVEPADQHD